VQRPSSQIVQSLQATLQQLEENFPSLNDQPHAAELKRIILLRIADLEFAEASLQTEPSGIEQSAMDPAAEIKNLCDLSS
jgi:hypothetical protein